MILYVTSSPLTNWHIQWNSSLLRIPAAKTFFAGAGGSKYSEIQKLNLRTGRVGGEADGADGEPGNGGV